MRRGGPRCGLQNRRGSNPQRFDSSFKACQGVSPPVLLRSLRPFWTLWPVTDCCTETASPAVPVTAGHSGAWPLVVVSASPPRLRICCQQVVVRPHPAWWGGRPKHPGSYSASDTLKDRQLVTRCAVTLWEGQQGVGEGRQGVERRQCPLHVVPPTAQALKSCQYSAARRGATGLAHHRTHTNSQEAHACRHMRRLRKKHPPRGGFKSCSSKITVHSECQTVHVPNL